MSPARSSLVVTMSLVQTARLLASCGQTAAFAVLVNRLDDPVDSGVATDGLVLGVNEDDLKVLVSSVLVDPVRVYLHHSISIFLLSIPSNSVSPSSKNLLNTLKLEHRLPTRSSAVARRDLWYLSWLTPWLVGFP